MEYTNITSLKPLSCCVCDTSIVEFDKIYHQAKKTPLYKDVYITFTNSQKMRVQMCKDCFGSIDQAMIDFVMLRHFKTWEETGEKYDLTVESFTQ